MISAIAACDAGCVAGISAVTGCAAVISAVAACVAGCAGTGAGAACCVSATVVWVHKSTVKSTVFALA